MRWEMDGGRLHHQPELKPEAQQPKHAMIKAVAAQLRHCEDIIAVSLSTTAVPTGIRRRRRYGEQ